MGKPFRKELDFVNETYNWAQGVELPFSNDAVYDLIRHPTLVVGSGGSFSACHMFAMLHQSKGGFSKPVTPLELYYSSGIIRNSNLVFLSSSGRNTDILFAYNTAIKHDPTSILGICMKKKTKLSLLANSHSISKIVEFNSPAGKDGFLATNSLVAYFTLLSRFFGVETQTGPFHITKELTKQIKEFVSRLSPDFTITVLFAGWSQPVAIDLESKFTEAGLGNILFSDYRNFAHGRHNWFDKKQNQSAMLALITPEEKVLAQKTLSLLPDHFPILILSTDFHSSQATIDLLIQSFELVNEVGKKLGIDPGRPGVPPYGSKIYNLRYQSLMGKNTQDYKSTNAVLKKTGETSLEQLGDEQKNFWFSKLEDFRKKMKSAKFGSLILDYDGTLSTNEERKKLPSQDVIKILNTYLEKGFIIGIVTGRGKSIREALFECLEVRHHDSVIIGYYNGAVVAPLTDLSQPSIHQKPKKSLVKITNELNRQLLPGLSFDLTLRPFQLTIESRGNATWSITKNYIIETVKKLNLDDIQVLESGHSLDIISKPEVSKLNIVDVCIKECRKRGIAEDFVCIGDKGKLPGNDFELLTSHYSLSVDEVSADPQTCWNLSDLGNRGVATCLQYLQSVSFKKSYFTLSV